MGPERVQAPAHSDQVAGFPIQMCQSNLSDVQVLKRQIARVFVSARLVDWPTPSPLRHARVRVSFGFSCRVLGFGVGPLPLLISSLGLFLCSEFRVGCAESPATWRGQFPTTVLQPQSTRSAAPRGSVGRTCETCTPKMAGKLPPVRRSGNAANPQQTCSPFHNAAPVSSLTPSKQSSQVHLGSCFRASLVQFPDLRRSTAATDCY